MKDRLFYVGEYTEQFNVLTGQRLPRLRILQSEGLIKHVAKHHPAQTKNVVLVPKIIASPDYIGRNPREPDSVELVKAVGENVMVCVKLNVDRDYYYVASVYEISDGKLQSRVANGRLKRFV